MLVPGRIEALTNFCARATVIFIESSRRQTQTDRPDPPSSELPWRALNRGGLCRERERAGGRERGRAETRVADDFSGAGLGRANAGGGVRETGRESERESTRDAVRLSPAQRRQVETQAHRREHYVSAIG